jgi:hypothetical protein
LTFQLFGRPLHPELFEVFESCSLERGGYLVKLDITGAGHVITWRYAGLTLTEVAASAQQPLPKTRRLLCYGLKNQRRTDCVECRGGVRYETDFQLETMERMFFLEFQRQLSLEGPRRGMLHRFDASGRTPIGALSYLNFEARDRSLLVQAFHTFPDDCAVLKSQSTFRLP